MSPDRILNIHRIDPENIGDLACSPIHYFPSLRGCKTADIGGEWDATHAYIVGGGGLLNGLWQDRLVNLADGGTPAIAWGIGCNVHGSAAFVWPKFLDTYALVGLRDWGNPWKCVPCPSCLHPSFDEVRETEPRYPCVIYEHHLMPLPISCQAGPRLSNRQPLTAFVDVLRFLAQGRVVISNSFHGLYWAMLLNRPTLCFQPFSNRFYCFQNRPVYCDENDWQKKLETAGESRPEYLSDCRERNTDFYHEVAKLLDLPTVTAA